MTNTIGGGLPSGGDFNWTLLVVNTGTAPASFFSGQVLVRDNLPAGATYGTPTVTSTNNVTNSGNIHCSLAANELTCTEPVEPSP